MIPKQLFYLVVFIGISMILLAAWDSIASIVGLKSDFNYVVTDIEAELMPQGFAELMLSGDSSPSPSPNLDSAPLPQDEDQVNNPQPDNLNPSL